MTGWTMVSSVSYPHENEYEEEQPTDNLKIPALPHAQEYRAERENGYSNPYQNARRAPHNVVGRWSYRCV